MNRAPEDDTVHACPDAAGAGREDRSIPMRRESALSSASYCGMEADLLSGGSSDAWSVGQLAPSPGLTRYSAFDLRVRGTRPFPIFAWPIPPSERYVQPTTTPRA